MPSLNFSPEFADDVAAGRKTQTIRPLGKRRWKVCDRVVCFTGQRRPGCRRLCEGIVERVHKVRITGKSMMVWLKGGGRYLCWHDSPEASDIANADGFRNFQTMRQWFSRKHGLPFTGQLIRWSVTNKLKGGES